MKCSRTLSSLLALLVVLMLAFLFRGGFNKFKAMKAAKEKARQETAEWANFLDERKKMGLSREDYQREYSKRTEQFPSPHSFHLTNLVTADRLKILNDTNCIYSKAVLNDVTGRYAILTTNSLFSVREANGDVKLCADISDWFWGSGVTNTCPILRCGSNSVTIGIELFAKNPIIIGPTHHHPRATILINYEIGQIEYAIEE